ncbi:hypothetical protein CDEST_14405 [Colletotrichum destructivum]|uniref:Uncharacterized protein n=1 Tax=Colletotrichum destructivum TaxID=34406 RepID=A0AAX4J1Y1_9PEZI|nr:hypothetical protein CDEST_14405 [Colletotrichum destructivum]
MASNHQGLRHPLPLLAPRLSYAAGDPVQIMESAAAEMKPCGEVPQQHVQVPTTPTNTAPPQMSPHFPQGSNSPQIGSHLPQGSLGDAHRLSHFDPRVTTPLPSTLIHEPKNVYIPFFDHQSYVTRLELYNVLCEIEFKLNCTEQKMAALESRLSAQKIEKQSMESKVVYQFDPPTPTAMSP